MARGVEWNRFVERLKRYLRKRVVFSFSELRKEEEFISTLWEGKFLRSWMVYELFHKFRDRFDSSWRQIAIQVSSGIEMVHLASLIHDDIMDRSSFRRGKRCVYKEFGKEMAIVLGDWLFFMGQNQLSEIGAGLSCSKVVTELCEGQMLEEVLNNKNDVVWTNYVKIASKKTARLFSLVVDVMFEMGIIDEDEWLNWWDWSFLWGFCYQVYDDLLDMWQDAAERKVTFVSICLRQMSCDLFSMWWKGKVEVPEDMRRQVCEFAQELVRDLLAQEVGIKAMNFWLIEMISKTYGR